MKDKLKIEDALEHSVQGAEVSGTGSGYSEVQSEAVQALTALGYGSTEALKAVKKVEILDGTDVETVLKQALKHIAF